MVSGMDAPSAMPASREIAPSVLGVSDGARHRIVKAA
jgi:hypothetical protein